MITTTINKPILTIELFERLNNNLLMNSRILDYLKRTRNITASNIKDNLIGLGMPSKYFNQKYLYYMRQPKSYLIFPVFRHCDPIFMSDNDIIGFSAYNPKAEQKYLIVFKKHDYANQIIIPDSDQINITEGNFDKVACGLDTICTYGGKISETIIDKIMVPSVKKINFCYDGDKAGMKYLYESVSYIAKNYLFTDKEIWGVKFPNGSDASDNISNIDMFLTKENENRMRMNLFKIMLLSDFGTEQQI